MSKKTKFTQNLEESHEYVHTKMRQVHSENKLILRETIL